MSTADMALSDLLTRLRNTSSDDRVATLEALYSEHHRAIRSLSRSLIGNTAEAEDAVQETFLAAWNALPSFRNESKPSTWLHRIAVRVAFKVKARAPAIEQHLERAGDDPNEVHARRSGVMHALSKLSAEQRTVISLFAVEGLTHSEIADILGIPEGTVWSRLHTARKRLAEVLRETE